MDISSLNMEEQKRVKEILAGNRVLKIKYLHRLLSINERNYLSQEYGLRDYLSVAEACIWLKKCPSIIYGYIKHGKIYAFKTGTGIKSPYCIDVKKTRDMLGIEY